MSRGVAVLRHFSAGEAAEPTARHKELRKGSVLKSLNGAAAFLVVAGQAKKSGLNNCEGWRRFPVLTGDGSVLLASRMWLEYPGVNHPQEYPCDGQDEDRVYVRCEVRLRSDFSLSEEGDREHAQPSAATSLRLGAIA
jgi:hypothetical protein